MGQDKKVESARVVGHVCLAAALLLLVGAIVYPGSGLLVIGLALFVIGIGAVADARRRTKPPS